MVKGFANHRRIEILELLADRPELCVGDICEHLEIEMKTASEHLRRMVIAGLVIKRYDSRKVRHALTDRSREKWIAMSSSRSPGTNIAPGRRDPPWQTSGNLFLFG